MQEREPGGRKPYRLGRRAAVGLLVAAALAVGYVGGMAVGSARRGGPDETPKAPEAKRYSDRRIAPGDVLGVFVENVLGEKDQNPPILAPSSEGENNGLGYPLTVDERGELALPFGEPIPVAGLTPREAVEKIRDTYSKRGIWGGEAFRARIFVTVIKPYRVGT